MRTGKIPLIFELNKINLMERHLLELLYKYYSFLAIPANLSSMSERLLSLTEGQGEIPKISSKPKQPTVSPTFADKNEDLLLGIATYLFCALCPPQEQVTLPNSDEMRQHFIDAHVDDRKLWLRHPVYTFLEKLQCRACPETEVNGMDLLSHMKIHMNRIYACRYCGKKGRKHFLKSHIRIHTGERPFQVNYLVPRPMRIIWAWF